MWNGARDEAWSPILCRLALPLGHRRVAGGTYTAETDGNHSTGQPTGEKYEVRARHQERSGKQKKDH